VWSSRRRRDNVVRLLSVIVAVMDRRRRVISRRLNRICWRAAIGHRQKSRAQSGRQNSCLVTNYWFRTSSLTPPIIEIINHVSPQDLTELPNYRVYIYTKKRPKECETYKSRTCPRPPPPQHLRPWSLTLLLWSYSL